MSVCIPEAKCGITTNYVSEELSITFLMSPAVECVKSSADVLVEGVDCSGELDGCASALVCARDIVDADGENRMSICMPQADCGSNRDYVSDAQGITFPMNDTI